MLDGRLAVIPGSVQLFVERFRHMGLDVGVVAFRRLGDLLHEIGAHPLRAGRAVPNVNPGMIRIGARHVVHDAEIVVAVDAARRRQFGLRVAAQLFRQAGDELLVLAVAGNQVALERRARREGRAHAGEVVAFEGAVDLLRVGRRRAAAAMDVDHRGDARRKQPRRADQGGELHVLRPQTIAGKQPRFEMEIGHALLDAGAAGAVVMRVDQPGHEGDAIGTHDRRIRMRDGEIGPGAHRLDRIPLEHHRAVGDHVIFIGAADHPAAACNRQLAHDNGSFDRSKDLSRHLVRAAVTGNSSPHIE